MPYGPPRLERLGNLRRIAGTSLVASINPPLSNGDQGSSLVNTAAPTHGLGPSAVAGAGLAAAAMAAKRRRDDAPGRSD